MGRRWLTLILQQFLIKSTQLLPLDVAVLIEIYLLYHIFQVFLRHWATPLIQNVSHYCLKLTHRKMMVILPVVLSKDLIHSLAYFLFKFFGLGVIVL